MQNTFTESVPVCSDDNPPFTRRNVIGTYVSVCTYEDATASIVSWALQVDLTYTTCHVNTHGTVNAVGDSAHQEAMNAADLVTPDGWPIVKFLRKLGERQDDRVYGPDLMKLVCARAAAEGIPIGLYGSKETTLNALEVRLKENFPGLVVAYKHSPPFRPLSDEEVQVEDDQMRASGARIYFIGLGCPKQEIYVHGKKLRGVPGVFMAVGAAIDINSGLQKACPEWMKQHGYEWLFRLLQDPKRLWKRYARYPFLFLVMSTKQLLSERKSTIR